MSHRLQVLIPSDLDAQLRKAAQRNRVQGGVGPPSRTRVATRVAAQVRTEARKCGCCRSFGITEWPDGRHTTDVVGDQ